VSEQDLLASALDQLLKHASEGCVVGIGPSMDGPFRGAWFPRSISASQVDLVTEVTAAASRGQLQTTTRPASICFVIPQSELFVNQLSYVALRRAVIGGRRRGAVSRYERDQRRVAAERAHSG
jgi:hypothetical protein